MRYRVKIEFIAEPIYVEVEADSLAEAWGRRQELTEGAEIEAYEAKPTSIEEAG